MKEPTSKQLFLHSVTRCMEDHAFIPAFYEQLFNASDEIKAKFRFTDFEKQNAMLRRSLLLCAEATAGRTEALREVNERATTHDRDHLDIEPHLYAVWIDTIITTASDFDLQWNADVEAAWRKILGHVVQQMIRRY
ncbi:globin [Haliea salexigens]|uniref:globin n=1 Tax=Haliea salexigens TaxID=287487 RepID=UPI0003F923FB|nr:globin [Haliea salexigens]